MGSMGYSGMSPFRISSSVMRTITLKNRDGSVAGRMGVSQTVRGRSAKQKKPKKVQYKFKYVSSQILRSKKAAGAGQAVSAARQMAAALRRMLYTGEYDDTELKHAIEHAERMVRIAKKKKKHLQEEENAGKHGGLCQGDQEQPDEDFMMEKYLSGDTQELSEITEEEMRELLQEIQDQMEDLISDRGRESFTEEELAVSRIDMDPEDLEALKKKHRAQEWKEILEADMKYLKAMFDKYQQDRKNAGGFGDTGGSRGSSDCGGTSGASDAVSLEIGGTEIPVTTGGDVPVVTEGAGMDTLV